MSPPPEAADMTAPALIAVAVAMLLVRLGWGGKRGLSSLGWAVASGALIMLAMADGAWGIAIGTVGGSAVALIMVLQAGWTTPAKRLRVGREPVSIALPHRPGDVARRVAVFLLVVPVAFVAAQWLAFGAQALARRLGAGDADAIVLTLFLQPLLWAGLMAWQMTRPGPAHMLVAPAGAAAIGTLLWSLA